MEQYSRDSIINNGIKYGMGYGSIDRTLRKYGHSGLTIAEANRISPFADFPKNALMNLGNLGAGAVTAVGSAANSIARGKAAEDIQNFIANSFTNKSAIPNALLSTYDTSIEGLQNRGTSGLGWDIAHGVLNHPIEAAIDFATVGGGKVLSAGKSALAESKLLNKIANSNKYTKTLKAMVLPTKKQQKVSKALTTVGIDAKVGANKTNREINELVRLSNLKGADIKQATRNARFGTMEGTKETQDLTKQIHKISQMQSKEAIKLGLLGKEDHYKNTLAQYITDVVGGNQTHKQSLNMVERYFGKKKKLEDPKKIKLVEDAMRAFDEGRISFLSQVKRPTKGFGKGEIVGEGYFGRTRAGGKTTPELQAEVLPETFEYVNEAIRRGKVATHGVNYLLDNVGSKVTLDDVAKAMAGELDDATVFLKKDELQRIIKANFYNTGGKRALHELMASADDTEKIIEDFVKSNRTKLPKDIYKVDIDDLQALARSIDKVKSVKINNFLKRALLTLPKWFLENRYSNWLNNFIDGVDFRHYYKAIKNTLEANTPAQIDELTSYAGLIEGGSELGGVGKLRTAYKDHWNKLSDAFNKKDVGKILSEFNTLSALDITGMEAIFEKVDRLASFIKNAEEYAEKVGKSFDEIYELSKVDNNLFWTIYEDTNKALGDYVGRNMYVPNNVYAAANFIYPFWRFPVESMKVTGHQILNHPFRFQGTVGLPARAGARQWEEYKREFGLPEDEFTGGVLYRKPTGRFMPYQFLSPSGNQYTAIANTFGAATGTDSGSMLGFNPLLTAIPKYISMQTGFGSPARIPNTVQISGRLYDVDKNGRVIGEHKVTGGERLSYVAEDALNMFIPAYRRAKYFVRPLVYGLLDKPMGTPYNTVINPFQQGDPYSMMKTTPIQKMGGIFSAPVRTVYPEYKMNAKQIKRLSKQAKKKRGRQL